MHTALMEASMDGHTDLARLLLDSWCKILLGRDANLEEVNDKDRPDGSSP